ncbi:hypothetical protein [Fimbriiglobus ruber]|uniref:hypothetical protein n=1 Tax=Fimbriiglobus ruber TaxID=1908690 RepID=UPI001179E7E1|nr:hypothetical protein [Fimbriiglobus ruber]
MTRIRLTPAEHLDLLDHHRRSADPAVGYRAHILLLLADGNPWATIGASCSARPSPSAGGSGGSRRMVRTPYSADLGDG